MRLWSVHPQYLDAKGIVALWREALLAKKVLEGKTKGYRNHPQLERFKEHADPALAINRYLLFVYEESLCRGYQFDKAKIRTTSACISQIIVTRGQIVYEFKHLLGKLKVRDPQKYAQLKGIKKILPHPLFKVVPGKVESWEKPAVR